MSAEKGDFRREKPPKLTTPRAPTGPERIWALGFPGLGVMQGERRKGDFRREKNPKSNTPRAPKGPERICWPTGPPGLRGVRLPAPAGDVRLATRLRPGMSGRSILRDSGKIPVNSGIPNDF